MATPKKRVLRGSSLDQDLIDAVEHNDRAGARKVLKAGPDFKKQSTVVPGTVDDFISGRDVSAGGQIMPGTICYLYNNAATVAWVSLSVSTIGAAPSSFATGIPLAPNSYTVLNAGENSFIRTSAATVGLYEVLDDTALVDAN